MKKILFIILVLTSLPAGLTLFAVGTRDTTLSPQNESLVFPKKEKNSEFVFLHDEGSAEIPASLLQTALSGYELLLEEESLARRDIITIIDFSLPSDQKRMWVLDLIQQKVLFHCLVSHGRNSGELMAEEFSNTPGSFVSSPGFYATAETYYGRHGLSLNLDGLEEGINDKARERRIVIHGADYVSDEYIGRHGRLGRSFGCPAIPEELSKEIIETIQGGSCLFIYVPKPSYTANSQIISRITSSQRGSVSPLPLSVFDSGPLVQPRLSYKHLSGTEPGPSRPTTQ